ncbi:MAG: ParA family protein [Opitutales bacterium]|nr:ParA family protein [Opitutales bacterium]
MKVIALYNIKGGVGKTAAAVNLAHLAASGGKRTLLCDLDPQAAATFYLRVRAGKRHSAKRLIRGGGGLDRQIRESDFPGLHLLPAKLGFRNLDLKLDASKRSRKRLAESLRSLADAYDLVVIDAPPNITLLSENVIVAADLLLCPVIPTTLSLRTWDQLDRFLRKEKLPRDGLRAFFSMAERRKKLHASTVHETLDSDPRFFSAVIPMSAAVERMGPERAPLFAYDRRSAAARAFQDLWTEIQHVLF